jgi:hypothetical protein
MSRRGNGSAGVGAKSEMAGEMIEEVFQHCSDKLKRLLVGKKARTNIGVPAARL